MEKVSFNCTLRANLIKKKSNRGLHVHNKFNVSLLDYFILLKVRHFELIHALFNLYNPELIGR